MSTTTTKTSTRKKPAEKKFSLAEWLTNSDDFSHLDVEVFMSPRYKEWSAANAEFHELMDKILGRDEDQSAGTLGEPDADQTRAEELHDKLRDLTPQVEESRKILRFVDAATERDLRTIDTHHTVGDDYDREGAFFEMLERFGLFEGEAKTRDEWEMLARRVGVWQWTAVYARCMEYLKREVDVTPDFSLPSLPMSRE